MSIGKKKIASYEHVSELERFLYQPNILGDVKKLKVRTYGTNSDGRIDRNMVLGGFDYVFNKDKSIIEQVRYEKGGTIDYKILCKYRADGNFDEVIEFDSSGEVETRSNYTYIGESLKSIVEHSYYDGEEYIEVQEFDEYGSKLMTKSGDGGLVGRWENFYDDKGRVIEIREFDTGGEAMSLKKTRYEEDQLIEEFEYCYDSFKMESRYDLKDNLLLDVNIVYEYDSNGNVVKSRDLGGISDISFIYDYTYDKQGNWISQEEYSEHVIGLDVDYSEIKRVALIAVTEREITY